MDIQITTGVRAEHVQLGQVIKISRTRWGRVEEKTFTRDGVVLTVMPTTRETGRRQTISSLSGDLIETAPSDKVQAAAITALQAGMPDSTIISWMDSRTVVSPPPALSVPVEVLDPEPDA